MHERVDRVTEVDLGQGGEPGRAIGGADTRQLARAGCVLPCVEEEQLVATGADRLFDRLAVLLDVERSQGDSQSRMFVQISKGLDRVEVVEDRPAAVVLDCQIRVVLLGQFEFRFERFQ